MIWTSQFWTSLSLDSLLWLLLVASSLLLLVGLFVGNIDDFLDGLEALRRRRQTSGTSGSGFSQSWQWRGLYLSHRLLHGSLLAKIMVLTYLMISATGFYVSTQHPVVLVDSNVAVLGVSPDLHTLLLNSQLRGTFQLIICRDVQNSRIMADVNPQPGYSLDRLVWEVTGRGCSSVNESTLTGPLGFWWYKEKGNVVKTVAKEN